MMRFFILYRKKRKNLTKIIHKDKKVFWRDLCRNIVYYKESKFEKKDFDLKTNKKLMFHVDLTKAKRR